MTAVHVKSERFPFFLFPFFLARSVSLLSVSLYSVSLFSVSFFSVSFLSYTRNLQGCPKLMKRSQPLYSGPKFTILWGHVEEILLLNKFFSDCRYMPYLRRYSPTKLCDGAQMAIFGDFFASGICSEPHAAHFRPAF